VGESSSTVPGKYYWGNQVPWYLTGSHELIS
jgi:hypothetical protein